MDGECRNRLRQVAHGLHLPLAAAALPDRTAGHAVLRKTFACWMPGAASHSEAVGEATSSPVSDQRSDVRSPTPGSVHAADALAGLIDLADAPTCSFCGSIMTRNGSCYGAEAGEYERVFVGCIMSKNNGVHTVPNPNGNGWVNEAGGRIISNHHTQQTAIDSGRREAIRETEHFIHIRRPDSCAEQLRKRSLSAERLGCLFRSLSFGSLGARQPTRRFWPEVRRSVQPMPPMLSPDSSTWATPPVVASADLS